ncbi:hypothetical protein F3Y22_tig00110783pilonHSYRG00041 [Hibiscus syriacus]|uniref:Reverse transcriptase zinc-binding domain-containing protein n=1 Tax=Hibiscus syriacus TaxID=106335 RepID=A0A6A2ZS37_HIBSY|nr:hypothetical protein F3Y22_tig00110783pilonHSYRG00041 [Hibiscus syriacus]
MFNVRKVPLVKWDSLCQPIDRGGLGVRLWDDIWVPQLGPLRRYALRSTIIDENVSITDLVTSEGLWNIEALDSLLTRNALPYNLGIRPPVNIDMADSCMWRWGLNIVRELYVPWCLLFSSLAWQIWKKSNDQVFTASCRPQRSVFSHSTAWAKLFYGCKKVVDPLLERVIVSFQWQRPPVGWYCLNADGALFGASNSVSIGGAIGNSAGN